MEKKARVTAVQGETAAQLDALLSSVLDSSLKGKYSNSTFVAFRQSPGFAKAN
jgi:hypothetical protein